MGLLDDAIREHLDLKRRRGADPAELERAEREALGPVRRKGDVATAGYPDDADEAFDADADADEAPVGSSPAAYDQAEEQDWESGDDELALHDAEPDPAPPRRSRRSAAQDDDEHDQPRGLAARFGLRGRRTEEEDEDLEPEPGEPPPPEDEATRVHRASGGRADPTPIDGETAEHAVPGAHSDADPEGEDVLEETPEFLQDTPDHDRLWFEQRPPRDFDFDG